MMLFMMLIYGFLGTLLFGAFAEDFADMQSKELSNGRLAMIAVAGMCVQELVNGRPVLEDLPFFG